MKHNTKPAATGEFRKYIKELRQQRGLSIRQLAKRAGIDSGGLAGIENGRTVHCPRPETIKKLAQALQVPEAELLTRIGYNVTPPDLDAYLRQRYGHLSEGTIAAATDYIQRLAVDYDITPRGPNEHEDEIQPPQPKIVQ